MASFFRIIRSIGTFSIFTLISRVLGLLRDILIARYFGASLNLDVFVVAFKIPNFFRRIFGEGVISQVFLPYFAELKSESQEKLHHFFGALLFWQLLILASFLLLFFLFYQYFLYILAPGFAGSLVKQEILLKMMYWTMPYLVFTSLMALFGAVLNLYRVFFPVAAAPIFLNISFLVGIFWGKDFFDIPETVLAHAVFWGGLLQFLFILLPLYRLGFSLRLIWMPFHLFFQSFRSRFWSVFFALSLTQINLFVDIWMASFLSTGSISWLYYADRLFQFPVGIFSVALSTVILSEMSLSFSKNTIQKANEQLSFGMQLAILIGLPASIGLFVLSEPIVQALFGYGHFVKNDVLMSAYALSAYSLGLLPWILSKLLINAFHVHERSYWIVRISALILLTNIVLNLILMQFFGHIGLALATSISGIFQSIFLIVLAIYYRFVFYFKVKEVLKIIVSSFFMLVFLIWIKNKVVFDQAHMSSQLLQLFSNLILPAGFIYFLSTYFFNVMLVRNFLHQILNVIFRRKKL